MNFDNCKIALIRALGELDVTEYEMYYATSNETSVETLNKEVNKFSSSEQGGLCLRVLYEGKMGYASTELMDESTMYELASSAIANAKCTDKLDTVGIYKGSPKYEEKREVSYTALDAGELRRLALATAGATYARDKRVCDGSSSSAITAEFTTRLINSHGLDLSNSAGVNILVGEAVVESDGEKQQAFSMREYGKEDEELTIDEVATKAVGDALDKIGAGKVKSGKYNVVIDSKQMRSLLSVYSGSFSAKSVIDKMSRLEGKLGEAVAAPIVTVIDDPQREGSPVGTTFDAEGVATYKKCVIENGVLKTYLHNRETAKKMGVETTANASKGAYHSPIGIMPYAFTITAGDKTLSELFTMAGDGIYITSFSGLHAGANPVTGDFSLQSQGFIIKDGKRGAAVKGFTLAGNFFELMKNIAALSDTVDMGVQTSITAFGSPCALVPDMSVAGE